MINPLHILKRFWSLAVLVLILLAGAGWWLKDAFNDRGYAPIQPIAFSHKLHAGELKMDCKYCHSQVADGKHASIPPMSSCMGCHSQVATDKPEVQKMAEIIEKKGYTDAADEKITLAGGAVHWKRVHRLPDHVYFTHQWHVKANVSCQTCHGPVEEMVTLRQHTDLTMGWCLDCHRKENYVGEVAGRAVGAANNTAVIAQMEPDPVVVFLRNGHSDKKSSEHGPVTETEPVAAKQPAAPERQLDRLKKLIAAHPELKDKPQWQVADLPASHREFYGEDMLMNAQTQCSTCHQ